MQEAHAKTNSREARGNYTWYFSGEVRLPGVDWTAGVGVVVENKLTQHITDIEQIN